VALHLNVGRAWRAPTLFELFAHGPHIGEARYEQGDSTLRAETSRSVDVGLRVADRACAPSSPVTQSSAELHLHHAHGSGHRFAARVSIRAGGCRADRRRAVM